MERLGTNIAILLQAMMMAPLTDQVAEASREGEGEGSRVLRRGKYHPVGAHLTVMYGKPTLLMIKRLVVGSNQRL